MVLVFELFNLSNTPAYKLLAERPAWISSTFASVSIRHQTF